MTNHFDDKASEILAEIGVSAEDTELDNRFSAVGEKSIESQVQKRLLWFIGSMLIISACVAVSSLLIMNWPKDRYYTTSSNGKITEIRNHHSTLNDAVLSNKSIDSNMKIVRPSIEVSDE